MRTHGLCLSLTLIAYINIYWYINRSHFLKDCFMVLWFIFVADGAFCYWCWSHLFSSRKCNTIDIKPNLTCENKINSCVLPRDVEVPGDLAFSDKVQTQVSFFFTVILPKMFNHGFHFKISSFHSPTMPLQRQAVRQHHSGCSTFSFKPSPHPLKWCSYSIKLMVKLFFFHLNGQHFKSRGFPVP